MIKLKVELGGNTYPLFIGIDILANLGEIYKLYGYNPRTTLITDLYSKKKYYFDSVVNTLKKINSDINTIFLSDQQIEQGLITVQDVALQIVQGEFKPGDTIISIGGSRVTSISAFIAQLIHEGTPYLQIPTTLTAQHVQSVDPISRINFESHFNLFSINFTHSLVWTDIALLKTLPEKNFISGLSYMIQTACQAHNGFFEYLEKNLADLLRLNTDIIEEIIFRACQTKIDILNQNLSKQKKTGMHNFGEYIASVIIETSSKGIKYGEALLIGMLVEGIAAFKSGIFEGSEFEKFYELLNRLPLNRVMSQIDQYKTMNYLKFKNFHDNFPALRPLQEFGVFNQIHTLELSEILSAFDLAFSK